MVTLRPETPADEPFLRRLLFETIAEELGALAWPEPMRSHLLEIQYTARRHSRAADFPEAASHIIQTRAPEADAGWLVVHTPPDEVRLVEIMVAAQFRAKGIGSAAIHHVFEMAAAAHKPVRLNVNVTNQAALRLYERLGFRRIDQDAVQYLMEKPVDPAAG